VNELVRKEVEKALKGNNKELAAEVGHSTYHSCMLLHAASAGRACRRAQRDC
jgi:hypothetical protein